VRLGIRLPNWLGDALLARRALQSLIAAHGAAEVSLAAPPPLSALLAADLGPVTWIPTGHGAAAALALGRAWRRLGVQRAVLLPPSLSSRLAGLASGAAERVGLAARPTPPHESQASLWLTCAVPRGPRGERHLEDEYLDLAAAGGGAPAPRRPLALPPGAAEAARALLAGLPEGPYLAVAPGARYGPAKRWPPERFGAAARLVARRLGASAVVTVGEASDREACARVAAALGTPARDLSGRTDLAALAGVLAGAAGLLSNDSGAAHLGAALGRPTTVVFGSTDPRWTAPRGPAVAVLWHRLRCAPCFRRSCPWVDGYACLSVVDVPEVVESFATPGGAAAPPPAPPAGLA
jgi:heptosyltransferase-2